MPEDDFTFEDFDNLDWGDEASEEVAKEDALESEGSADNLVKDDNFDDLEGLLEGLDLDLPEMPAQQSGVLPEKQSGVLPEVSQTASSAPKEEPLPEKPARKPKGKAGKKEEAKPDAETSAENTAPTSTESVVTPSTDTQKSTQDTASETEPERAVMTQKASTSKDREKLIQAAETLGAALTTWLVEL